MVTESVYIKDRNARAWREAASGMALAVGGALFDAGEHRREGEAIAGAQARNIPPRKPAVKLPAKRAEAGQDWSEVQTRVLSEGQHVTSLME